MGIWKVDNALKGYQLINEEKRHKRKLIASIFLGVALVAVMLTFIGWVLSLEVL